MQWSKTDTEKYCPAVWFDNRIAGSTYPGGTIMAIFQGSRQLIAVNDATLQLRLYAHKAGLP
jgi:hypothetical protein